MKPKVTALIAARMGSSRFPGKTLSDLCGKSMLERLIERIKFSKNIDNIVVATTMLEEDYLIEEWCKKNNIGCFRGSDVDVLGRLRKSAEHFKMELIVEILGDNPLVHSSLIDDCLKLYKEKNLDYVATLTNEYPKADVNLKRFPIGVRVQVFSVETIKKCERIALKDSHREHATSFIAQNPDIFKTAFLEANNNHIKSNRPDLTFAVNEVKNLDLIRNIFSKCYINDKNFSLSQALEIYDDFPEWGKLMGNSPK
jgi:spore coat polysaccharide biosynthesis protein SpsF